MPARFPSHRNPRSPTGKEPTRPNFRGTAIMTVIFLHLEERAHFLPARHSHPRPWPSPPFSLRRRRRRERSAPAILLKPTATIAARPFFTFCFSAPRSYHGQRRELGANYSACTNNEMELSSRCTDALIYRVEIKFD